jgi:hypothetical protein
MAGPKKVKSAVELKSEFEIIGLITVENVAINVNCDISQTDIKCDGIEFIDCTFNGILSFLSVTLKYGIKFINCYFKENLIISNCIFADYHREFNDLHSSILIRNCTINKLLSIKNCSNIGRGIHIADCQLIGSLFVQNNTAELGGFNIEESMISKNCDLEHNNFANGLGFYKCVVHSVVRIPDNKVRGLSFIKNTFHRQLDIWSGQTDNITFNYGEFSDDVIIKAIKATGMLTLIGVDFKTDVSIEYTDKTNKISGGCPNIYIHSCTFGNGLFLLGTSNTAERYKIQSVEIRATEKLQGQINIRNFEIDEMYFFGVNSKSTIKIHGVFFQKLKFDGFTNYSKIQFMHVKALYNTESSLEIKETNLGSTELYNVDLSNFKRVTIFHAILFDLITSNVKWFDSSHLMKNEFSSVRGSIFANTREVYRQLKVSMEKQGNKFQALEFKANEMRAYSQELRDKKLNLRILSDRAILWLGRSNNHGQSWLKPLILIIISTLFFYWLLVVSISPDLRFQIATNKGDILASWKRFEEFSPAIPKLVNPAFILEKVFPDQEGEKKFTTALLELFHRVILAYLLFQLVSAFRKFVK